MIVRSLPRIFFLAFFFIDDHVFIFSKIERSLIDFYSFLRNWSRLASRLNEFPPLKKNLTSEQNINKKNCLNIWRRKISYFYGRRNIFWKKKKCWKSGREVHWRRGEREQTPSCCCWWRTRRRWGLFFYSLQLSTDREWGLGCVLYITREKKKGYMQKKKKKKGHVRIV